MFSSCHSHSPNASCHIYLQEYFLLSLNHAEMEEIKTMLILANRDEIGTPVKCNIRVLTLTWPFVLASFQAKSLGFSSTDLQLWLKKGKQKVISNQ